MFAVFETDREEAGGVRCKVSFWYLMPGYMKKIWLCESKGHEVKRNARLLYFMACECKSHLQCMRFPLQHPQQQTALQRVVNPAGLFANHVSRRMN